MKDLQNILQVTPQWLMIRQTEWTFLPWALFNCFGSLAPESDQTIQELKTLLNEDPRILVLSANPKKYYTQNILDLMIENFHGRQSDMIIEQIRALNNWQTPTEVYVGRIHAMYGSMREFIRHYQNLLGQYHPTHVIFDDKILIDAEFNGVEQHIFSMKDLTDFYQQIKETNGINNVQKFISHENFLLIPSDQLEESSRMYSYKLGKLSDIQCQLNIKTRRENRVDLDVNYMVNRGFLNTSNLGKFKVYCYHNGLLKLP